MRFLQGRGDGQTGCSPALITEDCIRSGAHRSTADLEADILAFIDAHNEEPKPFVWTKPADDIPAAIKRFCLTQTMISQTSEAGH